MTPAAKRRTDTRGGVMMSGRRASYLAQAYLFILPAAVILGCPTFNQNILLPIYQVFALANPIRDKGKLAAAFGSYGWSGEGAKLINANLANLKFKVFDDGLMVKFTPHRETLDKCVEYGKAFGTRLLEMQ